MKRTITNATAAAGLLLLAACESGGNVVIVDPATPGQPRNLEAAYTWVLETFQNGQPVGHPAVDLTWLPPAQWNRETFRVYGRRAGASGWSLIATVTSCTTAGCVYRDRNVAHGQDYEFYVAAYSETSGRETSTEFREFVRVPAAARPSAPTGMQAVGLDGAAYLRWNAPQGDHVSRYLVYLTRLDGQAHLYGVGRTDGPGFLDERAANGAEYGYRVAVVDTLGHVSDLGPEVSAVPRPDFTAELIYAHADVPGQSGFRFQPDEAMDPILSGTSTGAHWRLESGAGGYRIVPLNGTQVTEYGHTTALVCGPGADAGCVSARVAPAGGYTASPLAAKPEFSYVFRVPGPDGPRFGVVRVTMLGQDQHGRDLMIFDWAFQTRVNEPRLNVTGS
jgi:hypothetical protein